ncbi:MAG: hypothetical protein MH204_11560, partial [Fimbriimonadaceae bacterium]|nr:hypothetical protein [Fimbriimonadaceae bacterium]
MIRQYRGTLKFILPAVAAMALVFGGLQAWTWWNLRGYEVKPMRPGEITILAVTPGQGYRVIVANRVAQLGEVSESEEGSRGGFGGVDTTSASNLKRIPMRELLQSLDGDGKGLGLLVERMNDTVTPENPASPIVWTEADIRQALAEEGELRRRLELDLQTTLDGRPIAQFSASRVLNGITILTDVPIEVNVGGEVQTVVAKVRQRYQTRLATKVEKEINEEFNPSDEKMVAIYAQVSALDAESNPEDVRRAIEGRISDARKADL